MIGPREECLDTHRRCLDNPGRAVEGPCPVHPDGRINLDCACEDCAALDSDAA